MRESHILFQKSPQVFQGEAHTLCKIDESNNNVGRATVFDTEKKMWRIGPDRCDSWFSFGKQNQLQQFRQFRALTHFSPSFHIGPKPETLRDTQTPNMAIPCQGERRGQTLGICRQQRRSHSMCPRWDGQFTMGKQIRYQDFHFVIITKMFDYSFIISYIL